MWVNSFGLASDCNAEKLFITFRSVKKTFRNIMFQNILVFYDNAFVMIKKFRSFKTKLEKYCKNLITMSLSYICIVANAACTAIPTSSMWRIDAKNGIVYF